VQWFVNAFAEHSIGWLLLSTTAALASGFLSTWLAYRFIKLREINETALSELRKQAEMSRLAAIHEREERVRREVTRWANPILEAVKGLSARLGNILNHNSYLALGGEYQEGQIAGWSATHDYFLHSTMFLFGQYFAWTRLVAEELNFELFEHQEAPEKFFETLDEVRKALGRWPLADRCSGKDIQVFTLQQRAIGELLIVCEGETRKCMGYRKFLSLVHDAEFEMHLKPLRSLLEATYPDNQCVWSRLQRTMDALIEVEKWCDQLLKFPDLRSTI
jgi:hypothetical protein